MTESGRNVGRYRLALTIGLIATFALAGAVRVLGQDDDAPSLDTGLQERVEVSLVLVEAVVLDRAGRHVRGLTREDFSVREAGRDVRIVTFDEIDVPGAGEPRAEKPPSTPVEPPSPEVPAELPAEPEPALEPVRIVEEEQQRTLFLVFDGYNNASALHLTQARRAAKKFLRKRFRSGDQAAIYELSPFLRSVTNLSADVGYLEEALDEIRWYPGESLADQITDATVYHGRLGSRDEIWERMANSAVFGADRAAAERRQYFDSLTQLGLVLEQMPGRKVVVLFSGGFPFLLSRADMSSGGFGEDYRRMMRQLERARATVYTMNIGEEPMLVDATVATTYRDTLDYLGYGAPAVDDLGRGIGMGGESSAAYNQFMAVLSHETGGRFFAGYDYDRSLGAVDDDSQHFYLIGYEPPSGGAEGRYRPINIAVRKKGVSVQTRQGRFMTERGQSRLRASVPPPSREPRPRPEPEEIPGPAPVVHTLSAVPVFFPTADGRTLVSLLLRLDGAVTPLAAPEGHLMLDISSRIIARTAGEEVARSEHSFRSNLRAEAAEPLERGLRVLDALTLAPGSYDLAVTLRLNGLGVEADWQQTLDVPAVGRGELAVAGMTMLAGEDATPLVADVFTANRQDPSLLGAEVGDPFRLDNGWRVVAAGSPSIASTARPTFFFRVYNPTVNRETHSPEGLTLEYTLVPADGGSEILPPTELGYFRTATDADAFDVLVRLDLALVEPGRYRLRVDASEGEGDRRAQVSWPVEVTAASNSLD